MPHCSLMSMGTPLFISKLKFSCDKYSVYKVWTKMYCHFYLRGITLRPPVPSVCARSNPRHIHFAHLPDNLKENKTKQNRLQTQTGWFPVVTGVLHESVWVTLDSPRKLFSTIANLVAWTMRETGHETGKKWRQKLTKIVSLKTPLPLLSASSSKPAWIGEDLRKFINIFPTSCNLSFAGGLKISRSKTKRPVLFGVVSFHHDLVVMFRTYCTWWGHSCLHLTLRPVKWWLILSSLSVYLAFTWRST